MKPGAVLARLAAGWARLRGRCSRRPTTDEKPQVWTEEQRADLLELRNEWLERAQVFGLFAEEAEDRDMRVKMASAVITLEMTADELMEVIEQYVA
jgi:hypothetical protein